MEILLFIDSLGSGGAQRQIVGLAKLLQGRGNQIKIIYYHPINFYRAYLNKNHIPHKCVDGAQNKLMRLFLIAKVFHKYQPKVVISFLDTPNIIACSLKAVGMRFRLIAGERNTTQAITVTDKIKFFLLRWADSIVTNSYSQGLFINKHFPILSRKVETITNFVDLNLFVPLNKKEQKDFLGRPRILVVGRVSRQKNTLRFLQSLYILKKWGVQFYVDWYGREDDNIMDKCKLYIANHELEDVCVFHEPVNEIVREYQKSDIFCLPSIYEGFPNVICEAMSCGLPILCSNICDNSLLVESGVNGLLFNPNDVKDMAEKMMTLLSIPYQKRLKMGARSRQKAEESFSEFLFIKKYEQLLNC